MRTFAALLFAVSALAQTPSFSGDWQAVYHQLGGTQYFVLTLAQDGDRVTGVVTGLKLECRLVAGVCEGDLRRGTNPPHGKIKIARTGADIRGEGSDEDGVFDFVARRPPMPPAGGPRTLQFNPTVFHNYFSSKIEPAMRINPGDTVETKSVDAGGSDENGKRRSPGGNPLTGPFYIDGAWPGDTLVVKINKLRLNRKNAFSGSQIVGSALSPGYLRGLKYEDNVSGEWTLDRENGVARLAKPLEHLKNYTVPLKPMLGCIGVAPPQEQSYRSGFLGPWGGNMDYREFGEGVTLYFGVNHPGALLFLGDGHAAQGSGELTGDALETSTEYSFTVELIKGKRTNMVRSENAEFRMASGIANSLPEALQSATTNLSQWLADDYKLTPSEIALVLGTSIRYEVAEVVDPLVHVVAKIEKKALAGLN